MRVLLKASLRGYRYVTRGDDVLIIDPDEQRVVEVID